MKKIQKHEWVSLNRSAHEPGDMTLDDLFAEIRCAVQSDDDVLDLATLLDSGQYLLLGRRLACLLKSMHSDGVEGKA